MSATPALRIEKVNINFIAPLQESFKKEWVQLNALAQLKDLQESFEKELLSRFDEETLKDHQICKQINEIFQESRSIVKIFIDLASTYKIGYYTHNELKIIISRFMEFKKGIGEMQVPESLGTVPHYDQGGDKWMKRCILALKTSKAYSKRKGGLQKKNDTFSKADQNRLIQIIEALTNCSLLFSPGDGEALIYWYKLVKETQGESIFVLVSNPLVFVSDKTADLPKTIRLLQWIVEIGDDEISRPILLPFYRQQTSMQELLEKFEIVKKEIETRKYPEKNINEVLKAFSKDPLVSVPLPSTELEKIEHQFAQIQTFCQKFRQCEISELVKKVDSIRAKKNLTKDDYLMLIAVAREAIRLKFKVYPYNTQIFALLGILNHPQEFKGRIAQVRTGEGKSTLIAMLAFYNACLGYTVDIISSSYYLAERDQVKYRDFYQLFGITSSHLCTDQPTEENFKGQIIFGTNSDFEFAIMWDSIREKKLRTLQIEGGQVVERPFHVAIVDEVDNLFIDTALNSARISLPSAGKYGWLYQPVLAFVKDNFIPVVLKLDVVAKLRKTLETIQNGKFKSILAYLEDEKLDMWMQSAVAALRLYNVDQNYVVMPVEKPSWAGKKTELEIVLIDKKNTGRKMHGMQAARGVHQFLEAKHNLAIHADAAVPASLSHPVFFENYSKIYGCTGTLGSPVERKEIEKIYHVDTFDVPPHKTNLRKLLPPLICNSKKSHYMALLKEIQSMIQQERPTLIGMVQKEPFQGNTRAAGIGCETTALFEID